MQPRLFVPIFQIAEMWQTEWPITQKSCAQPWRPSVENHSAGTQKCAAQGETEAGQETCLRDSCTKSAATAVHTGH